jgi:AAA domain
MLKIIKSSQPIHITTLVGVLYSPPGLGKTTMAFTADKPLLLDCDKGSHRAKNRKDVVQVDKWSDITDIKAEDFAGYSTIVVDTAGRALDALALDIIRETPKYARGGSLSLQGFGELKTRFVAWLKMVRSFGLDVILIAHSDETRNGDEVIERLDVQGGSKNEIYKSADFMGRISILGGRRMFNLSPTETAFGKNPGQLPPLEVPDYAKDPEFLAGVIARTKDAINSLTEEQTKVAAALGQWAETIGKASTVEDFNALIEPTKGADEVVRDNVKRLLVKVAKERGYAFDGKLGAFTAPEAKKAETAPAEPPKAEREPGSDDGDDRGDAPTPAELEAAGQTTLPISKATKAAKGKAA